MTLPLLLLVVVTVLAYLLAVLEATLRGRTILGVVALLVPVSLLAVLLLRLLVALLLVAALVVSTLLRVRAVSLRRVLLLLTVALVVLVVSRHGFFLFGIYRSISRYELRSKGGVFEVVAEAG